MRIQVPLDCVDFDFTTSMRIDFGINDKFLENINQNGINIAPEAEFVKDRYIIQHGVRRVMCAKILGFKMITLEVPSFDY